MTQTPKVASLLCSKMYRAVKSWQPKQMVPWAATAKSWRRCKNVKRAAALTFSLQTETKSQTGEKMHLFLSSNHQMDPIDTPNTISLDFLIIDLSQGHFCELKWEYLLFLHCISLVFECTGSLEARDLNVPNVSIPKSESANWWLIFTLREQPFKKQFAIWDKAFTKNGTAATPARQQARRWPLTTVFLI